MNDSLSLHSLPRDGEATVGFVPTMGALHEGHLRLVRAARAQCDRVVVSVFVNPTQFEPHEDFDAYPRDYERDRALLVQQGVDQIWFPTPNEIYPEGLDAVARIEPPRHLTDLLCGRDRPYHFSGVATVVKRLFNAVRPTDVYFGQKDYQQTRVIDWLIQQYFEGIRLHVEPTVREHGGLAMSSRNRYLSPPQRAVALKLQEALSLVHARFGAGERQVGVLKNLLLKKLQHPELDLLYAEIRGANALNSFENQIDSSAVVAVAARVGSTRLIDNVLLVQ